MSPTHHAPKYPDYTTDPEYTVTDDDRYDGQNPHLQWQRQPIQQQNWNHGYETKFVTKTVSGFMDFVTTVGNTVMVFTPQGSLPTKKTGKNNHTLAWAQGPGPIGPPLDSIIG